MSGLTPRSIGLLAGLSLGACVVSGVSSTVAVKDFSSPRDITANKDYYLLADDQALVARDCSLVDHSGANVQSNLTTVSLQVGENFDVQNVALPLVHPKGVYSQVAFDRDLQGVTFTCAEGTNYISTISSSALQTLWWLTVLTGAAGIALLAMFFLTRRDGYSG